MEKQKTERFLKMFRFHYDVFTENDPDGYSEYRKIRKLQVALTPLNRKNSGVNGVELEKMVALTPINRKISGVNGV